MSIDGPAPLPRRSVALFGNARMLEVVLALAKNKSSTAKDIATITRIPYTNVRDVLIRLINAEAISGSRIGGGTRAPLYYTPRDTPQWCSLVDLAAAALNEVAMEPVPQH